MNRKETQGVLALLRAAYPNFYKGQTKEDLLAVVNLWQIQFADFACEDVLRAVHALIATRTEGYPPTIGAVKGQAAKLTEKSSLSEAEAWAMVSRAARNGLYRCREEYDKLPPAVQKAVGDAEQLRTWAAMDEEMRRRLHRWWHPTLQEATGPFWHGRRKPSFSRRSLKMPCPEA